MNSQESKEVENELTDLPMRISKMLEYLISMELLLIESGKLI